MTRRRVLVLNHFAVPVGEPGGTRHTELFGALPGWDHLIVASRTNLSTHRTQRDRPGFRFVPVTPYRSNGVARIGNWMSYAVMAVVASLLDVRRRPAVVYASSPHLLAAAAGAVIAAASRAPLVLEIRDLWPKVLVEMGQLSASSPICRALAALESWLYRRADRIVVLADGVARSLEQAGVPVEKITVIPNAADPEYFDTEVTRDDARARYGFDRLTFVYAGAHGPANGLGLLLDAAAVIGDDIGIVLVGDGVSRAALVERAVTEGLTNVRFLDPLPKAEMPRLLHAADIGVHCLADVPLFHYGVSPNKLFDYMAAGKPVITNTPGDVAALVTDSGGGIAVSPSGLAAGISRMAEAGADQLSRWGCNGRRHIRENQSRQVMAKRLNAMLDTLVPDVGAQ
ncbi:glycosyltransferase family 4 protein [Pseudonocardia humida]|uniref:Glycosyltransferase family 4 protein n=1 Tax=Pseudonocardia humida TaxID=2800819 RepID=A0ABT0ZT69_9PSEU|nr:glycosyltransferase family 4 protein [Pseudonocardia humida]MCO1653879.1 glycosyltransferase family 4 protein [Pseudonocardia humida]